MTNNLEEEEDEDILPIEHDAVFVLLPIVEAKDSSEARKIVELSIQWKMDPYTYPTPVIGGYFSGLLSDLCGEKAIVPYYNKELRDVVQKNFSNVATWLKNEIKKATDHKVVSSPDVLKGQFPEFKKYSDTDLFYAIRLELAPMGLDVGIGTGFKRLSPSESHPDLAFFRDQYIAYIFRDINPYIITPEMLRDGRDILAEFGYEDDAKIINNCLYQEIIEKEKERVIDIFDIGQEGADYKIKRFYRFKREDYTKRPEKVIGKMWIILVDYVYHKVEQT